MPAPVVAAGLPIAGSLIGKAIGGKGSTQAAVPDDMQGMRAQQMGLLNFLLGMGPDPRNQTGQMTPEQQGTAWAQDPFRQNPQGTPSFPQIGNGQGGPGAGAPVLYGPDSAPGGPSGGSANGGGVMTPQQRIESLTGPLGINASPLQQTGSTALQQMTTQMSPEQRAIDVALPQIQQNLTGNPETQAATNKLMGLQTGAGADVEGALGQFGQGPATGSTTADATLEGIANQSPTQGWDPGRIDSFLQMLMGGGANAGAVNAQSVDPSGAGMAELSRFANQNAGQGVVDASAPMFDRNLAAANQQGGRFGSGNAILRSRAVDDANIQNQRALLEGRGQQITAANALGNIGLGGDNVRLGSAGLNLQGQLGNQDNLRSLLGLGASTAQAGDQLDLQALLGGTENQLSALGQMIGGRQGLDQQSLQGLSELGGLRLQGQGQEASNAQAAGQLGLGQTSNSNQAASILGQLFGQQGNADLARANSAFNAGTQETQQQNYGNQRAIDIILQQLGVAQGATMGGPVTQTPSGAEQGAQMGGGLAQILIQALNAGKGGGTQNGGTGSYNFLSGGFGG